MASVTVPGTTGSTVTISSTYNNSNNSAVAKQIADLLAQANNANNLTVSSVGSDGVVPPPVTTTGAVNELLVGSVAGGQVTIPSSGNATTVVVYDSSVP
jgi:hypothetical protein